MIGPLYTPTRFSRICTSYTWLIWYGPVSRAPYRTVSRQNLGLLVGSVVVAAASWTAGATTVG